MRLAFPLLLFCLTVAAAHEPPISVRTSDFTERRERLPSPPLAPSINPYPGADLKGNFALVDRSNSWFNGTRPAGKYDIAYSLLTEDGKLSRPGPAVSVVALTDEWIVIVRTPGVDHWTRAVGTVWWFRPAGSSKPWQPLGGLPNLQIKGDVDLPALPLAGWQSHDLRGHMPLVAIGFPDSGNPFWRWDDAFPPPPAPVVRLVEVPNVDIEVAYSWACNFGETALSPVTRIKALPTFPAWLNTFAEVYRGLLPPQGALGAYVYVRYPGKPWHRQKAPHGDSYLWPLFAERMSLYNFELSNIPPGAGPGDSILSPLNQALRDTDRDVIVDSDFKQKCPVINPFKVQSDNRVGRTISTVGAGNWNLEDDPDAPGPSGWPVWMENASKTRLIGARIRMNRSSWGIAFLDWDGGGSFHFHAEKIELENGPSWWIAPWYIAGVAQNWSGRGVRNDHAASEAVIAHCKINARFPVVCEPNQARNWQFVNLDANGSGGVETAIATIGNSGDMSFIGRFTCDNARTVVAACSAKSIYIEAWHLDQGFPCWFTVAGKTSPEFIVNRGQANGWRDWQHVIEVPSCPQSWPFYVASTVRFSGTTRQTNGAVEDVVYAKGMVVVEPVAWGVKKKPGPVVPVVTP